MKEKKRARTRVRGAAFAKALINEVTDAGNLSPHFTQRGFRGRRRRRLGDSDGGGSGGGGGGGGGSSGGFDGGAKERAEFLRFGAGHFTHPPHS